ncbi:DUF418 domain-containing protein [Pseudonocardia sp. ICBG162]|uniref:DUF418 domain-containing protein n=1 Tax=Pseudonocardia sp. ICBG162 TaxID=2846761 RepID=UPI001CF6730E|nr:DUF418 domain-containing protein [Pseudonocardia sp. ICBG162]
MSIRSDTPNELHTARLVGIDVARGLAVFGMFAAHVGPDPSEGVGGLLTELASGRASALFAVLAGLSLAIMSGRARPLSGASWRRAAGRIAIRGAVLLVFGTAMTMTGTSVTVILAYYGVFFLLALPFSRLRAPALAVTALVAAVVGPVLSFAVRRAAGARLDVWTANDPVEMIGGEGLVRLFLTGGYPVLTWMPFLLAGMALGRVDLTDARTRLWVGVLGPVAAVVGYGGSRLLTRLFGVTEPAAGGPADAAMDGAESAYPPGPDVSGTWRASGVVDTDTPLRLLGSAEHTGTPFEILGATGVAVTVVVLLLAATERWPAIWRPVAAVGTMGLTVYTLHVIAIGVLGLSAGPGEPGYILAAFVLGAVVFALVWSRFFRRGPLEELLHRATAPAALLGRPRERPSP